MARRIIVSGVEMDVVSVSSSEVKIRVGSHEITFGKRPNGKAIKKADFFLSSGSYGDVPPIPEGQFRPAARVATAIFHSRFNGHRQVPKKDKRKNRGEQLILPGI